MGNGSSNEAKEVHSNLRVLDVSRKLSPDEYEMHMKGELHEGSLENIPLEIIYYDEISLFEEINISFNSISFIPAEFSLRVPHLRNLFMSHNQLSSLPTSFHFLLHLRILDLSFNKFESYPETINSLLKLESLNFSHNTIKDIPPSISKLKHLKRLNVSHNALRALPESLLDCPSLDIVICLGNGLIHPPQSVCDEGTRSLMEYLSSKKIDLTPNITPRNSSSGVFRRIRGQQAVVSVRNPDSANQEYKQAQSSSRSNKKRCPMMIPDTATLLSPDQLKDTLLGLVYGACIGDAFGLNMEGLSEEECKFFYYKEEVLLEDRIRDLLRSHFSQNDWSSHSDIMLLTLDSTMRWGGVVDELEIASLIVQWLVHGFTDIDPIPGHPLSQLQHQVYNSDNYAVHPHSSAHARYVLLMEEHNKGVSLDINPRDNSCLPSALVLGIANFHNDQEVTMNAERICRASHSSPLAVASAVFIALCVSSLLKGKFHEKDVGVSRVIEEIKQVTIERIDDHRCKTEFEEIFSFSNGESEVPTTVTASNDVSLTIRYVIRVLSSAQNVSFRETILSFLYLGREGLSAHCSVIGGIVGALLGYSNVPQEWLQSLPQKNKDWLMTKLNHLLDLFGLP